MGDYNLHEKVTMQKLYDEKKMWIGAYFREIFHGTIQSTQQSETMNSMVKGGYVDNGTPVHEFARKISEMLDHIWENEARERYYSQVFLHCVPDLLFLNIAQVVTENLCGLNFMWYCRQRT